MSQRLTTPNNPEKFEIVIMVQKIRLFSQMAQSLSHCGFALERVSYQRGYPIYFEVFSVVVRQVLPYIYRL